MEASRFHGAHPYRHGVAGGKLTLDSFPDLSIGKNRAERREELRNLIRLRYAGCKFKPAKIQFMNEVENKVPFLDTEAAKVLRDPAVGVAVRVVEGRCIIEAEKESQETPPWRFQEAPSFKPTNWIESIYQWYEVAIRIAKYCRKAHRREMMSTAIAIHRAWDAVRTWWFGSSNTS